MKNSYRLIWCKARSLLIITAVVTQSLLPANNTFALPSGGQLVSGQATVSTPSASTMLIGQQSNHAIINWNSFGIGKSEAVTIEQPTSQSTLLNRVLGNDPSAIFGTLTANGRVFLVNPNGMVFAPGSSVNVGGMVASTLAINDADFLSQNYSFLNNGRMESLINQGSLNGELVELIGSVVNNSGVIHAKSMTERDGKIVIEGAAFVNTGTLIASDITANVKNLLDAGTWSAAGSSNGGTIEINATGSIEQTGISQIMANGGNGGDIRIIAGEALYLSGIISTNGKVQGGKIALTAPHTTIAGAQIEANGRREGGTILVGGGWQGNDAALANANKSTVTETSKMSANALDNGNGGTVVIWSDQSTVFAGSIEARGGTNSGNGGNVEVSSHENLSMIGQVATTAQNGKNGLLLLDPRNITIDATTTTRLFSIIPLLDPNPAAGDQHGSGNIVELNNGNIVVASPLDDFVAIDAGAVRLYKPDGTLLSTLIGSSANDQIGEQVIALTGNNNAVTLSRKWSGEGIDGVGAATWIDGNAGSSGSVSSSNSLIGSTLNDARLSTLTPLANGNYIFALPGWDNGAVLDTGAVTWGDGTTGSIGVISALNSLVGSSANDGLSSKVTMLTNGNYVVSSYLWDRGTVANAGAVTWGNGLGGTVGIISTANSLAGSKSGDNVGMAVTPLSNGNYVIGSPNWDNGTAANAGAATWVNGAIGAAGTISTTNSLVGTTANDKVSTSVTALSNGNYVINSPSWDNVTTIDAGAVTWVNGTIGSVGTINSANSLIGSVTSDELSSTVVALTNGNYVVASPNWDNGLLVNAGAVTWGDGVNGTTGTISPVNSLVGSTTNDGISYTIAALKNGNYVIGSPHWDNGSAIDVGAVTWGNGMEGTVGIIGVENSLVGSTAHDGAIYNITALSNGNYVVGAPNWDNGTVIDAGAVTWGDGVAGTVGTTGATNSLVGSTKNDFAGSDNTYANKVTALKNGNYIVASAVWDKGAVSNAGAVTWGDGATGTAGEITMSNSLVGSKNGDQVGSLTVALPNGDYVVGSSNWDNGSITNAGAVTSGNGLATFVGAVSSDNSITGSNKDEFMSSSGIIPLSVGTMNSSFIISSMNSSTNSGRVEIVMPKFAEVSVQQEFSSNPGEDNTFTPAQITALLNTGNNLILKANNNIIVNSPIVANNTLGNGGNLAMNAGKSLFLNANITTNNGNLTLIANDKLENGVVDAMRSTGNAVITMGNGTALDTGTGSVTIELCDGIGLTNRESGDITLCNISASSISAINNGQTTGSGITLAGALAASATSGNSIILAGQDFNNNTGSTLSTSGTARWLIYSDNPGVTNKGVLTSSFRHYNASATGYLPENVSESGNGFIYTSAPGQILVTTILASGKASSYYGDQPDATYGYTLTGFADNEDNAQNIGLTGTMNVIGNPTASSNTGNYTITYTEGLSSSAGFTFISGSGLAYTIQPQPITIIVDPQDKPYGSDDPEFTWTAETMSNGRGLIPGDLFTGELSRSPGENVSAYAILQNTLDNSNYEISYTGSYLTINPRPVKVSANPLAKIYGDSDPALTWSAESQSTGRGLLAGDSFNGALSRVSGENVQTENYPITQNTLNNSNYAITYTGNYLTIQPRSITLNPTTATKIYGEADPSLAVTITNGSLGNIAVSDELSDVTGMLNRQTGSTPGIYDIALGSGNKAGNYTITYNTDNNAFTITKRPINISANSLSKTYGDPDPSLTWQAETPVIVTGNVNRQLALNTPQTNSPENETLISQAPVEENLLALGNENQFTPEERPSLEASKATTSTGFTAANPIIIPEPVGALFTISLPGEIFIHNNPDAVISFDIGSVNGSSIPSWMSFDPVQKVISGTPPNNAIGNYKIEVIAKDQFGGEMRTTVLVIVR